MQTLRGPQQEAAEDIFFGQVVIIWARWFLIFAGLVLTLWTVENARDLSLGIIPVVALMLMNFYLHGRYVMERPANQAMILAASLLDLVIVTLIVVIWPGSNGLASQYFIFYYPLLLAVAFVFQPRFSIVYTGLVVIAYIASVLALNPEIIRDSADMETLVMRVITLLATGLLGAYYWRIQRRRRREAEAAKSLRMPA